MSNDSGIILGAMLFVALFIYILWPEKHAIAQRQKTRLDLISVVAAMMTSCLRPHPLAPWWSVLASVLRCCSRSWRS